MFGEVAPDVAQRLARPDGLDAAADMLGDEPRAVGRLAHHDGAPEEIARDDDTTRLVGELAMRLFPELNQRARNREGREVQHFRGALLAQPWQTHFELALGERLDLGAEIVQVIEDAVSGGAVADDAQHDLRRLAAAQFEHRAGEGDEAEAPLAHSDAQAPLARRDVDEATLAHGIARDVKARVLVTDACRQIPGIVRESTPFAVDQHSARHRPGPSLYSL